VDHRLITK